MNFFKIVFYTLVLLWKEKESFGGRSKWRRISKDIVKEVDRLNKIKLEKWRNKQFQKRKKGKK